MSTTVVTVPQLSHVATVKHLRPKLGHLQTGFLKKVQAPVGLSEFTLYYTFRGATKTIQVAKSSEGEVCFSPDSPHVTPAGRQLMLEANVSKTVEDFAPYDPCPGLNLSMLVNDLRVEFTSLPPDRVSPPTIPLICWFSHLWRPHQPLYPAIPPTASSQK